MMRTQSAASWAIFLPERIRTRSSVKLYPNAYGQTTQIVKWIAKDLFDRYFWTSLTSFPNLSVRAVSFAKNFHSNLKFAGLNGQSV